MIYVLAALVVALVFALGVRVGYKLGVPVGFHAGAGARKLVDATGEQTVAKLSSRGGVHVFALRPANWQEKTHDHRS